MSDGSTIPWLPCSRRTGQEFLRGVNRLFARVYHRVEVMSPSQIPLKGAGIVICNHTSGLDPQLIQSCNGRLITWMMAREYYEIPVLRNVLDVVGVIPVARNMRDSAATKAAIRALNGGQMLGLFPEGKIETSDALLPFEPGAALLAMKTEVPVYPCYLDGTQRGLEMGQAFARRQEARIIFGPPLRIARSHPGGAEAATRELQNAVAALRDRVRKSA